MILDATLKIFLTSPCLPSLAMLTSTMASPPRLVGENEIENAGKHKLKEFITPSQQTISVLKVTSLWIAQLNRNSKEKEKKRKPSGRKGAQFKGPLWRRKNWDNELIDSKLKNDYQM